MLRYEGDGSAIWMCKLCYEYSMEVVARHMKLMEEQVESCESSMNTDRLLELRNRYDRLRELTLRIAE